MTHDQFTPAPVEVTQADREAAMARDVSQGYTQRTRAKVLRGDKDEDELVQAFARHRIAHSAPAGEAEPVAWKITDAGGGYWFTDKPENPDLFDCEITQDPLYTHPAPPADLVDALRDELANYDAVVKSCPANKMFLGDKACPKCKAESNEGCREEIRACFSFLSNARAALAKHGGA